MLIGIGFKVFIKSRSKLFKAYNTLKRLSISIKTCVCFFFLISACILILTVMQMSWLHTTGKKAVCQNVVTCSLNEHDFDQSRTREWEGAFIVNLRSLGSLLHIFLHLRSATLLRVDDRRCKMKKRRLPNGWKAVLETFYKLTVCSLPLTFWHFNPLTYLSKSWNIFSLLLTDAGWVEPVASDLGIQVLRPVSPTILHKSKLILPHLCLTSPKRDIGKQCRPRSDAEYCGGVW